MNLRKIIAWFLLAAFASFSVFTFIYWLQEQKAQIRTTQAYVQGHLLHINAPFSGTIASIPVENFSAVKKGDILFTLDKKPLEIELQILQKEDEKTFAQYTLFQTKHQQLQQSIDIYQEQIDSAQEKMANYENLLQAFKSHASVVSNVHISQARKELADAAAKVISAKIELANVRGEIQIVDKRINYYNAEMKQNALKIKQQQELIKQSVIKAPIDGHLGEIAVKPEEIVDAHDLLALFFYSDDLWVSAEFKESDLQRIHVGDPAIISIDAYPNIPLQGHVKKIASASSLKLKQEVAPEKYGEVLRFEQQFPVVVDIHEPNVLRDKLKPGLSAVVFIKEARGKEV